MPRGELSLIDLLGFAFLLCVAAGFIVFGGSLIGLAFTWDDPDLEPGFFWLAGIGAWAFGALVLYAVLLILSSRQLWIILLVAAAVLASFPYVSALDEPTAWSLNVILGSLVALAIAATARKRLRTGSR